MKKIHPSIMEECARTDRWMDGLTDVQMEGLTDGEQSGNN